MMRRLTTLVSTALLVGASAVIAATPADAAGAIQFTRIQYDSPGTDTRTNASLNAEYVQLKNVTTRTFNLYRWTLRDAAGHVYTFSGNHYLKPGATVTIRTGKGTNTATTRYWGSGAYIWNNTGDKAYLKTPGNTLVDYCAWTSTGPGYKYC